MGLKNKRTEKGQQIPRKRPRQSRAKFTVDSILEAAARILVSDGYAAFNTNRVGEVAGVSVGSLYQYFPNKEAIVAALWERHSMLVGELSIGKLEPILHLSLDDILRKMMEGVVEAHRIDVELHRVLMLEVPQIDLSVLEVEASDEIYGPFKSLLLSKKEELRDDLNVDLAVIIIHRVVESVIHDAVMRDAKLLDGDDLVNEIHHMVMMYLAKKGPRNNF